MNNAAELKKFVALVRNMRRLQKKYFASDSRSWDALQEMKGAERVIDQEIKRLSEALDAPRGEQCKFF